MAIFYVRSTDGSNADNGSTWALAKATVAGAIAAASAGDTIYVSQVHSETTAGVVTWTSPGTATSPLRVICANDGAEPPTSLATTGVIGNTTSNAISIDGYIIVYGLTFSCNNGGTVATMQLGAANNVHNQHYTLCNFNLQGSSNGSRLSIGRDGATGGERVIWDNCKVGFAAAAQGIQVTSSLFEWRNGVDGGSNDSMITSTTAPTALFKYIGDFDASTTSRSARVFVEGLDLSAFGASMNLIGTITGASEFYADNCKKHASWTGLVVTSGTPPELGARAFVRNFENGGSINYSSIDVTRWATETTETTLVKTGGQTDGVTATSMKVVTSSICGAGSPWSSQWQEFEVLPADVGNAKTVTIDFLHDSATALKDDQIWIEVAGQGVSSSPLGIMVTDRVATPITTAADQPSGGTWTTTGMSNPNSQKCHASITPRQAGLFRARLRAAVASKTFYYDAAVMT